VKGPTFYKRWKCSPNRKAHFSIAASTSIHPSSRLASSRKHFNGCYFHSLSALANGALGAARLLQAFKHSIPFVWLMHNLFVRQYFR
jgi:hypothetical protein